MKKIILLLCIFFIRNCSTAQTVNFDWVKPVGSNVYNYPIATVADIDGNIYSTGYFNGTADFDPGPGIYNLTAVGTNMFILKLDSSGNFLWAKLVGDGAGTIHCTAITLDNSRNVYVTGSFIGAIDFDPGLGVYNLSGNGMYYNSFVLKLNVTGNFLWAKNMVTDGSQDNIGESIKIDKNNNVLVGGVFGSTVDFDPGPGVINLTCPGGIDMYILKLDNQGNFIWVKQIAGPGLEVPYSLAIDNNNNIISTGYFTSSPDFDPGSNVHDLVSVSGSQDAFILKLDNNGNFIWTRSMGGISNECGLSIVIGANNSIYTTGYFIGTTDFDPGAGLFVLTPYGGTDIYILKLDAGGNFVWAKQIGGISDEGGSNSIAIDGSQNIYIAGAFQLTADFDPGPGTFNYTADGKGNTFILKLNATGNFVWAKHIKGSQSGAVSIAVDPQRNVITTGIFINTVDFDPNVGIYNLTADAVRGNIYVHKMNQTCFASTSYNLNISSCTDYILNGETFSSTGIYTQLLTNTLGCDSTITLDLTINRKSIEQTISICPGQTFFAGGANQTTPGIYKDTLQTSLGCDSIVTTTLAVHPKPVPDLGPDRNLCSNGAASITPGSFNNYLWQDNSIQPAFTVSGIGKYWVKVTDANNCPATDTLEVLAIDTVPKNFLPANQLLCYNSVFNIIVPNYKNYLWSTGDVSPSVTLNQFGSYYLTVTDYNNCSGKDTVMLLRNYNCIPVSIPNAFTPNKDGKNDMFKPIINQEISNYSFVVFNRYGQKIFASNEYGKGWDGTFKGAAQPRNSYIYLISFKSNNGQPAEYKGTVTLLR